MFLIYKDGEIVERVETLRYILQQDNGVAVISTQESYNAVYSPVTDKTYPVGEFFVVENKLQEARELRRAIQLFLSTLDPEEHAETLLEVPTVFPAYEVGHAYKIKDVFSYGTNAVGDPQLYQVLQAHTSAEQWPPDTATSLYKKIGVTSGGYPEWVQPLGATDAYNKGDIVSYKGKLYRSTIDSNVWAPDAYPAGWEAYQE